MGYVAGIDGGSTTTKMVLMQDYKIIDSHIISTGANSERAAVRALEEVLARRHLSKNDIQYLIATGYGRQSFTSADKRITEITCQARAISWIFPGTEAIIDIGGQDFKIIRLGAKGNVEDFCMNNKCAAGTGRFLEVMSKVLELNLESFSEVSLNSRNLVEINSVCTVFAESEVVGQIAKGTPIEDLVKGILMAVATRVYATGKILLTGCQRIVFTGGAAKNIGLVKALEEKIGSDLVVPDEPQITGALGAALFAQEYLIKENKTG